MTTHGVPASHVKLKRAYEPAGLAVDEFDTFGPSVKTLRTFIGSYHELLHLTGEALLA